LEDHLEARPKSRQSLGAEPRQILPLEEDPSLRRSGQAHDQTGKRRLAAAGLADQTHALPIGQPEAHAFQRAADRGRPEEVAPREDVIENDVLDVQQIRAPGHRPLGSAKG
jgi:hypothetical protein